MSKAKTGFTHSAEAKQKISDTKKGHKRTWRTNEKVVEQIDNDGTIVAVYDSVSNAAAALGINAKRLYTALYRGKPTAGFN